MENIRSKKSSLAPLILRILRNIGLSPIASFRWGVLLIVFAIFSITYWRIKDIDPEGACREFRYFATCVGAIGEDLPPFEAFRPLPTDQQMIDKFYRHRSDFQAPPNQIWRQDPEWRKRSGIFGFDHWNDWPWSDWPKETYEEKPIQRSKSRSDMAFKIGVASTRYIRGVEEDGPWSGREKGYLYFPLPVPKISNGWLVGPMYEFESQENHVLKGWRYPGDRRRIAWRVRDQLDADWPEDWARYECLLRPIEPQWFLVLCKFNLSGG